MGCLSCKLPYKQEASSKFEVMVPLKGRSVSKPVKEEQENQVGQIGQHELEILCYP